VAEANTRDQRELLLGRPALVQYGRVGRRGRGHGSWGILLRAVVGRLVFGHLHHGHGNRRGERSGGPIVLGLGMRHEQESEADSLQNGAHPELASFVSTCFETRVRRVLTNRLQLIYDAMAPKMMGPINRPIKYAQLIPLVSDTPRTAAGWAPLASKRSYFYLAGAGTAHRPPPWASDRFILILILNKTHKKEHFWKTVY
jgi:hypothetical protein